MAQGIACIGLGFVGLNTALSFCDEGRRVTGYDIDDKLIEDLSLGEAPNPEMHKPERVANHVDSGLFLPTSNPQEIGDADTYIISVPTPVEGVNSDLSFVEAAAETVAMSLAKGDLVVLQSTVPIGTSENVLRPILETSSLNAGEDFGLSFVPERFSPGNPQSFQAPRLVGSVSQRWLERTESLYNLVAKDTIPVNSMEIAEAAKLIENVQRDVNIALINEFANILWKRGVDANNVLDSAATKWNFHQYDPGLGVGGHCIPVDPYHLINSASITDVEPLLMKSAREVNDGSPAVFADIVEKALDQATSATKYGAVTILGVTYKPGVKDVRNSPAIEFIDLLEDRGVNTSAYDPLFEEGEPILDTGIQNGESLHAVSADADLVVLNTYPTAMEKDVGAFLHKLPNNVPVLDIYQNLAGSETSNIDVIYPYDFFPSSNMVTRGKSP